MTEEAKSGGTPCNTPRDRVPLYSFLSLLSLFIILRFVCLPFYFPSYHTRRPEIQFIDDTLYKEKDTRLGQMTKKHYLGLLEVQVLEPEDYIARLLHHLLVFDFQGLDVGADLKQPGMEEVEPPSQLVPLPLHRGLADYLP